MQPTPGQRRSDTASRPMVKLTFLVPPEWRDALAQAAEVQRISMADLCRIIVRGFLRERYASEKQRALGVS